MRADPTPCAQMVGVNAVIRHHMTLVERGEEAPVPVVAYKLLRELCQDAIDNVQSEPSRYPSPPLVSARDELQAMFIKRMPELGKEISDGKMLPVLKEHQARIDRVLAHSNTTSDLEFLRAFVDQISEQGRAQILEIPGHNFRRRY